MVKSTVLEPEFATTLLQKIGDYWADLARLSSSGIDIQRFWEPSDCGQKMMTHAYSILELYLIKEAIPILDKNTISILGDSICRYLRIKWGEVEVTIIFDFLESEGLNRMKNVQDILLKANIFIVLLPYPPKENDCRIASDLRDAGISVFLMCPTDFNALISARWNFTDLIVYKISRTLLLGKKDIEGIYEKYTWDYFKSILNTIKINPPELDLGDALKDMDIRIADLLEHPLFQNVQEYLSTNNSVLIFGSSSSGKTSLAVRAAHNIYINLGWEVWYFDVGSSRADEVIRLGIRLLDRRNQANNLLLILDDLQTNPDMATQILLFVSHLQRLVFGKKLQIIGTSWPDLKHNLMNTRVKFVPIDISSSQLVELMCASYGNRLSNKQLQEIKEVAGEDLFVLRLALIMANDIGQVLTIDQIVEEFLKRRKASCDLPIEKVERGMLVASIIGQYECEITKTFLMAQTGLTETEIDILAKSKLIRYHRGLINAGHRSLCTMISNYLGRSNECWEWFRRNNKPSTPEDIVLEFILSLPPSQIWPILKAIYNHVGFKMDIGTNKGDILVDYWQSVDALLDKMINQQKEDPTWGQVPSSITFVVETLSKMGMHKDAEKSIEFLRDSYQRTVEGLPVKIDKLATSYDFQQIKEKMIFEDKGVKKERHKPKFYEPAKEIDERRFHENWVRGLILCAEAAYGQKSKTELTELAELVEKSAHELGYFYPDRVPWCTARILIGLGACGRNIHNSEVVKKSATWLLTPREKNGALEDGIWNAHTGGWNSPIETTALCITALISVGVEKNHPVITQAINFLLDNKDEWIKQGSELDGVAAIEAYSLLDSDWGKVLPEVRSLLRWAKEQALWLHATKRSDETFTQSCRIAQVASILVKLTWKQMISDLPALLKIFAISETKPKPHEVKKLVTQVPSEIRPKSVGRIEGITPDKITAIIEKLSNINLNEFYVVKGYTKYNELERNKLKDLVVKISETISTGSNRRENYLIWSPPGSGKTSLIEKIAEELKDNSDYKELNLSNTNREKFISTLHDTIKTTDSRNVICFIDEIDSKKDETWPFEILLSFLDANKRTTHRLIFVLAGSTAKDVKEFIETLKTRHKGKDLLSRIPEKNIIEIAPPTLEDKILLVGTYIEKLSSHRNPINFIEKFALFYLITSQELSDPRQMEDFLHAAIRRVPLSEDRLKYDHLFNAGDLENKEFWKNYERFANKLSNKYIKITTEEKQNDKK